MQITKSSRSSGARRIAIPVRFADNGWDVSHEVDDFAVMFCKPDSFEGFLPPQPHRTYVTSEVHDTALWHFFFFNP